MTWLKFFLQHEKIMAVSVGLDLSSYLSPSAKATREKM